MGRTNSASTLFQQQMKIFHNKNVDAEQVKHIHYGTVLQTDVSVGSGPGVPIPSGMMTVHIPDLGNTHVSDPLPYPGATAPLIGTQVSVGFDSDSNPIVIAMYGAATYKGSSADAFFFGG